MTRPPAFWELLGAGAAVGGTAVWGLAAAARVGLLRLLLEAFPRPSWDAVTWVLIPALLLLPPVLQGAAVGGLAAPRLAQVGRGLGGSVGGTFVGVAILAVTLVFGVRRLPSPAIAALSRTLPIPLTLGFFGLLVAGWVLVAGRLLGARWLRWAALPLGAVLTALAWILAHGHVVALSYVLDRPEVEGFFVSVALGGALGSAWSVSCAGDGNLTRREGVGYNPPAPG